MSERRFYTSEVRAVKEDGSEDAPIIEGYSAIFGVKEVIYGIFEESIARGAFARVLSEKQDTKALFDHRSDYLLGRVGNKTLEMREDEKGLFSKIHPNMSVSYAKDVVENIKRGDLHGQSFAFTVRKDQWTFADDDGKLDHREIIEVGNLYDVGPVTYPAYESTTVSAREAAKQLHKRMKDFAGECRNANKVAINQIILDPTLNSGAFQATECRSGYSLSVNPESLLGKDIPLFKKSTPISILKRKLDTCI